VSTVNLSSEIELKTTKYEIIRDAFTTINRFGPDERIDDYSYQFASRTLNRLLKNWMADGFNLWLRVVYYLFVQPNQVTYSIYEGTNDNFTENYTKNFTTISASAGDNFIVVDDGSNINSGDYIGVTLNTGERYWATVFTSVANTVTFNVGYTLPSDVNENNIVISYTYKASNPSNVFSGSRSIDFITDIPMNYLTFEQYFEMPNKQNTSSSMPVSYMYDRQLERTNITLWPNPTTADMLVKFVVYKKVTNLDINANEPDYPEEWHEAIVLNLAVRLCTAYGKNTGDKYANLKADAREAYLRAKAFDNEVGSLFLQPDNRHG